MKKNILSKILFISGIISIIIIPIVYAALDHNAKPTGGYTINSGVSKNVYKNDDTSKDCIKLTSNSINRFIPTYRDNGWNSILDNSKRPAGLIKESCINPFFHTFNNINNSSYYSIIQGYRGCSLGTNSIRCGIIDNSVRIKGLTPQAIPTQIKSIGAILITNPYNPDCRSKRGGIGVIDNAKQNSFLIYINSNNSAGWRYDCRGNCENKNYGWYSNNWYCLNGNGLCNGGGKYIIIHKRTENGSFFNYIYVLNGDINNGTYKFDVLFEPGISNNTKFTLKIYDVYGNLLKTINKTGIPNPTNGVNFTQGINGNFYPYIEAAKTCDRGYSDYELFMQPISIEIK